MTLDPSPDLTKSLLALSVVDSDTAFLIAAAINLKGRSLQYRRGKPNFNAQDIYDLFQIIINLLKEDEPPPSFLRGGSRIPPEAERDITASVAEAIANP